MENLLELVASKMNAPFAAATCSTNVKPSTKSSEDRLTRLQTLVEKLANNLTVSTEVILIEINRVYIVRKLTIVVISLF